MKKLPWYCRCKKNESQTLSIFSQSHVTLMSGSWNCPQTHSSLPPNSYEVLMESRLRNINGPQFASLGEWDGN